MPTIISSPVHTCFRPPLSISSLRLLAFESAPGADLPASAASRHGPLVPKIKETQASDLPSQIFEAAFQFRNNEEYQPLPQLIH
jgi:hypothetical protein